MRFYHKAVITLSVTLFFIFGALSLWGWAKLKTHVPEPVVVKQPAGMPRYTPARQENASTPEDLNTPTAPGGGSSLPPGTLPQNFPLTRTSPTPAESIRPPQTPMEQNASGSVIEPPNAHKPGLDAAPFTPGSSNPQEPPGKPGTSAEPFKASDSQPSAPGSQPSAPGSEGAGPPTLSQPQSQGGAQEGNLPPPPVTQQLGTSDRGMKFLVFLVLIASLLMFWWLLQLKQRLAEVEAKVRLQDTNIALWEEVEALPVALREALLHNPEFKALKGVLTLKLGQVYGFKLADPLLNFTLQVQLLREALAAQHCALYLSAQHSQAELGTFLLTQDLAQPVYKLSAAERQTLLKKNSKLVRWYQERLYVIAQERCSLEALYLQVMRLKQRGEQSVVLIDSLSVLPPGPKVLEDLRTIARKADLVILIFDPDLPSGAPQLESGFSFSLPVNYREVIQTAASASRGKVELQLEGEEKSKELTLHYATGEISS